jgi:hypothetical protein
MDASLKRKVVAGTVAALAVGGTGAGIAATKLGNSPSAESKAIVNDAAKELGVQPSKLSDAIKKALSARVDAAVAAGRLTKEQGAEMKARIASDNFPLFGPQAFDGGRFGHHGGPGLDAAAKYLGLTDAKLRDQLESGKTLAEVAKAEDKSVGGLISALKDDEKTKLDKAVSAGRLTKAQETRILADLDQRVTDLVNGKLMRRHDRRFEGRPFGGRPDRDGGPPAGFLGPAA